MEATQELTDVTLNDQQTLYRNREAQILTLLANGISIPCIAEQIGIQVESGLQFESEFLLAQSNYMHLKIEMLNAKTKYNNK